MTMTNGEYRVGIKFNPSGDDLVAEIKRAAADLIDMVESIRAEVPETEIGDVEMWQFENEVLPAQGTGEDPHRNRRDVCGQGRDQAPPHLTHSIAAGASPSPGARGGR